MAVEFGPQILVSLTAGADLSLLQFTFVKFSSGKVVGCSSATDIPIGVLQNNPNATGRTATVLALGISKVVTGANLAQGDLIGTDTAGKAVALVAGTDTTKYVVGRVLFDTSAASGDLTTCYVNALSPGRAA